MFQINKNSNKIGVSTLLTLILMIIGGQTFAQSKYSFQVTGGYAFSESKTNGYNIDLSFNRKIWDVISLGVYYDVSAVNNYITKISQTNGGGGYTNYFIPPALDNYIRSFSQSQAMNFSQDMDNFTSIGLKTNFDFKIAKKFRLGFYVGVGITKRVQSHFFLESWTISGNKLTAYKPASQFIDATELSFRYGIKLTYQLSHRINFVFQAGHNTSKFRKYPFNTTIYDKANLGVAYKF